ncbi:MAG: response regulator [Butyrivibrio sp.]|uniref:ATP-binding protein n=1 Tax=Butyrivibrio sp. TaxID=28121 RepID=UPI001B25B9C8|nr:ATP-binding protein [Butyrivibrio sp.]MBO6240123.1 response regulator [Butyrivibrio sp.]
MLMKQIRKIKDIDKKWLRFLVRFISVVVWLSLTRLCVYCSLHADNMIFHRWGIIFATFFLLPYLLLGGLYGYLLAYAAFFLSFLTTFFISMDTVYFMAIYLVATTCFALFGQYFWFKTRKKTILACLYTLLATSFTEVICLTVIQNEEYDISALKHLTIYLSRDVVLIFAVGFALHFFFTKAPDICKLPFPIATGYTDAYQKNAEIQRTYRKTRVSVKITTIIIGIEVFLGISAAAFMIALFPDMKDVMINSLKNNKEAMDAVIEENLGKDTDITSDDFAKGIGMLEFTFDTSVINYDIKMVLLLLCVGVPLGGFANYYTKMSIGAPLGVLSDFMYEFANADDDEKLKVGKKIDKIKSGTRDEIGVVFESSRTMVHSIEDYIGRIEEEQKLKTELEVAKQSSEAKSSFLSNMSHEIRTPINAVLGMNEMIIRETNDPQIEEYAQNVKSAGNSLLGIVNDILDFSKIEAGKMDILPVPYHLGSMINDLLNMIATKAQDKGLKLEINVDETIPSSLFGDEIRIKQCVTNILTNAVKYTEEGSVTMNVSYRKEDENNIFLRFQVVDTGIGIKEEDLNKLFSPFERIEEIRNRSIEGTGLGMSIVKKLLALMDTKLEVKSVYGEGSDFSFEVRQQVFSWEELGDFKQKYKEYLNSLKKYHEKFRAPEAEILVVDDTVMNLTVVKGLLKNTQIRIDTAESGMETLEKVKQKHYDVIFIDHRMPEMDGVETLAAMKTLEGNKNIGVPCIALTANAGSGAREEYIAAGFDDYLSKPVNGETLEDMLYKLLPKEKLQTAGSEDEAITESSDSKLKEETSHEDFLDALEGIDLKEALNNCGSREVLTTVVKEFLISLNKKADDIENFAHSKDFRNYTVAVHALKSSARLVGAMKLSKEAAYLEKCGNDENEAEIAEKTPQLLYLYRSYKDKFKAAAENEDDSDLPEISEDELLSAFSDIKELVEAYDYDTADGIMDMLKGYKIPDSYKEKYKKVAEFMALVDRDSLLSIL